MTQQSPSNVSTLTFTMRTLNMNGHARSEAFQTSRSLMWWLLMLLQRLHVEKTPQMLKFSSLQCELFAIFQNASKFYFQPSSDWDLKIRSWVTSRKTTSNLTQISDSSLASLTALNSWRKTYSSTTHSSSSSASDLTKLNTFTLTSLMVLKIDYSNCGLMELQLIVVWEAPRII